MKVTLDAITPAGCASYDAVLNLFQFNWKLAKNTSVGTHSINITVLNPDATVNAQLGLPINVTK